MSGPEDSSDNPRTRLIGARRRKAEHSRREHAPEAKDAMDDPVVGWLVVIEGPGKGRDFRLGYGTNEIGRGPAHRVPLDLGDDQITRNVHAVVTYDPRGRKFYVQHGEGRNLTYLDGEPVLQPTLLESDAEIVLGNTKLRFVSLCSTAFDWQDLEGGDES